MKSAVKLAFHTIFIAVFFLAESRIVNGQQNVGPDFDPLGLLEETQRRRESISAGTFGNLFNIAPEQATIAYADWNIELARKTGITYLVYYAAAGQFGSQDPPDQSTGNGNTNFLFAWTPTWQSGPNQGAFVFHYLNVGQYGPSGIQFRDSLGISSAASDSSANADLFRSIAWRQQLANGQVDLRIGQLEPTALFNSLPYANDNRAFLASPLSNEAARTLPAAGIGLTITAEILNGIFVGGALADANGKGEFLNFDSFFLGDYISSAYVAVEPDWCGLGKGRYQIATHFIDSTDTAAYSRFLGINLEQSFGEQWAVFAKYNSANGRRSDIAQSGAAGIVRKQAFGFQEDWLGIGFGWSDPTDVTLRDEFVLETFWRSQLTPLIQITPSIQFWMDPSQTPGDDFQSVFSIRALGEF